MRISGLCSAPLDPVNERREDWCAGRSGAHEISRVRRVADLPGGELLFLISCAELVGRAARARYDHVLVAHASDVPHGRGWSPHVWRILEGAERIVVSLLEAEDAVDAGPVWDREEIEIPRNAVAREIDALLFAAELRLMDRALAAVAAGRAAPVPQDETIEASYYPRRTPEDSRLDPARTIAEQFDLLRVCDPERYPAFFDHRGRRYRLKLEVDDE